MRGEDRTVGALFSYVDIEARIPERHPLRAMRRLTDAALSEPKQPIVYWIDRSVPEKYREAAPLFPQAPPPVNTKPSSCVMATSPNILAKACSKLSPMPTLKSPKRSSASTLPTSEPSTSA